MAEGMDQVWNAPARSDDRQRIGKRGTKAEPSRLDRSEVREKLADAPFQKGGITKKQIAPPKGSSQYNSGYFAQRT